jgi:farnesol dehydrogenase
MRVLVTGGTGYLGQAIVRALAKRGHEPVVFARHASSVDLPGRAVDGDVRDLTAMIGAARGCDAMCHAAALVSIWRRDPRDFDAVNVGGLEHAIAAVRDAGLSKLVYTSSFLARPPAGRATPLSANDYQRTKVIADDLARRARDAGAPIVRLYPGVVYGPGVLSEGNLLGRLLADQAAGRLPGLVGPERVWSYAWIDDVALAHVEAVERASPGADYELGGENVTQLRPFEIARAERGGRLPRRIPFAAASLVGAVEEIRARLTGRTPLLTRGAVEIFRHDWPVDSAAAARDLNFRVTPLVEGIRQLLGPTAEGPGPKESGTRH